MALCILLPANISLRLVRHGSASPFRDPKPRKNSPAAAIRGAPASGEVESGAAVSPGRRIPSGLETRVSLVAALASQTFSLSQRGKVRGEKMFFLVRRSCSHVRVLPSWAVVREFLSEAAKYAVPARRFGEPNNLEEALMSVPDLESVNFKVLKRVGAYEIREVESYFIAETTMAGKRGFDFNGSGQAFNVLAAYLFGKNTASEQMEMTTPVFTRKAQADGERMEMTTPVVTRKLRLEDNWQMSFVMPSKYGGNLPTPKDPSVRIREVPKKIVAVAAFSGFVTDEMVKDKELRLRDALRGDSEFRAKENTPAEVAQFNPPFTLPFTRRNEVSLEVERRQK